MNSKWLVTITYALTFTLFVASAVGCSSDNASTDGNKDGSTAVARKLEPVTIKIFNKANTSESFFETRMKGPVEKKYPHITLELVNNVKGTTLAELTLANNLPDMMYGKINDQELMMDLEPVLKKNSFDIRRIKPVLVETYKYLTDTDKLLFVPLSSNMHILHYNKGLFDKFGVPYPKDGMTWDETYELTKKLAKTEDGVRYLGFNIRMNLNIPGTQLLLPYYDDKTGKSAMQTDGWKHYFNNFSRFFALTNNEVTKAGAHLSSDNLFLKDQRVAMYASHPLFYLLTELPPEQLNWDIVSLPNFPEAPRQGTSANTNGLGITKVSKHVDDAFLVIQTLLSDEVQLANAWLGQESVLANDEKQQKEYGKDWPLMKGKNISALFYNKYAPTPTFNDYNYTLQNMPYAYFQKVVWGETDVNTALRQADEAMNKKIDEIKLTKK